jgi:hypothetical protein
VCFRVSLILHLLAEGLSTAEILANCPSPELVRFVEEAPAGSVFLLTAMT